jgi:two-component system, cell cycle sensor histidine kinase and response regulator CckA
MATILIVDDMPANRDFLVTLLEYGGHRLLQAGDGAEALALAKAEQPDLVIADINSATVDVLGKMACKIALGIERHRATVALREREEHIRLLLDSTGEAIYGIDLHGKCTFANPACARLLGFAEANQLLGKNMHHLVHRTKPDGTPYPEEECRIFQAFRQNQSAHADDEVFWRADGSSFPVEYWSYPINHGGQITGSVVTFVDITERRLLETQFRNAQQRLRHIVISSPAVLFTLSISNYKIEGISWISENLLDVIGYPPEVSFGSAWWEANIHPDDRERVLAQIISEIFTRNQCSYEYRFRHGDGSYHWTRCDLRLIRDELGQPSEAVGAWTNIAALKRAEEERIQLRVQLEQTRKLESIGQLAGGVAHDFNNILGVIIGYAEMLKSDLQTDSRLSEYTSDILNAAHRGTELTRQLLAFGRQQVFQPSVLSFSALVKNFRKMLRRVVPENIEIHTALKSTGQIRADACQIEQIIMNLAVNARDSMPAGGRLTIETEDVELDELYVRQHPEIDPGPYVMLAVTDSGHGMTPQVMARIFEPFFTTKERGKGTGLGLGIVHGIVKQSGGSIYVYSEPGRGTAIKVYLPRLHGVTEVATAKFPLGDIPRGTETILVAEDETGLRDIVSKMLSGLGYTVLVGVDGQDALHVAAAHEGPIHLLLTDVIMPGISGRELSNSLVRLRPALKVLYISGYTDDSVIAQGARSNQIPFLQKPFAAVDLAKKIRGVLDEC